MRSPSVDSADKALSLRESGDSFDAIISDIEMPGMNGFDFAQAVRAEGALGEYSAGGSVVPRHRKGLRAWARSRASPTTSPSSTVTRCCRPWHKPFRRKVPHEPDRSRSAKQARKRSSRPEDHEEFVTMFIDGQMFGIPVLMVQDVLGPQKITRIPLAPAGSRRLAQPARPHRHRHRRAAAPATAPDARRTQVTI